MYARALLPDLRAAARFLRVAAFLWATLLTGSCCDPGGRPTISVTVTAPADLKDVTTARGVIYLDDALAASPATVPGGSGTIDITLYAGARGTVRIQADGLRRDGCVIARGQAQLALGDPLRYAVTVTLAPLAAAECSLPRPDPVVLTVARYGEGLVTSSPAGIDCGDTCGAEVQRGTTVTLRVKPGINYRLVSWSPPECAAVQPTCTVTVNASMTVTVKLVPQDCASGGWCWENLVPAPYLLNAVWGASTDDVWMVGLAPQNRPGILHWNGAVLSEVAPPAGALGQLYGVHGSGPADVYAVGDAGLLLRWDGQAWSVVNIGLPTAGPLTGALTAVWAFGPRDVWLGANMPAASLFHYAGAAPAQPVALVTNRPVTGLWARAAGDLFAAADGVFHYDGAAWTALVPSGEPNLAAIRAVWGTDSQHVWGAGTSSALGPRVTTYDGARFVAQDLTRVLKGSPAATTPTLSIWMARPNDVYAVNGSDRNLMRYDGTSWYLEAVDLRLAGAAGAPSAVFGASASDIWFVGNQVAVHKRQ